MYSLHESGIFQVSSYLSRLRHLGGISVDPRVGHLAMVTMYSLRYTIGYLYESAAFNLRLC